MVLEQKPPPETEGFVKFVKSNEESKHVTKSEEGTNCSTPEQKETKDDSKSEEGSNNQTSELEGAKDVSKNKEGSNIQAPEQKKNSWSFGIFSKKKAKDVSTSEEVSNSKTTETKKRSWSFGICFKKKVNAIFSKNPDKKRLYVIILTIEVLIFLASMYKLEADYEEINWKDLTNSTG